MTINMLTAWKASWSYYDPLLLLGFFVCSWILTHSLHNLFFHPLRQCPGPFFARMTSWPSIYHAWKGDRHIWVTECFSKYGNKIRVEPNTVLFRSPTASRAIYSSKANVKRARFYNGLIRREEHRNTGVTLNNALHAKRRKLLNLAFNERSLRAAAIFMSKHTDRWNALLVQNSGDGWSEPLNFSEWIDALIFDILGDVCYGKSFEIKEPGHNPTRAVPHAIVSTLKFVYPICRSPLVDALTWLRPRGLSRLLESMRSETIRFYDEFVDSVVKKRLEREKEEQCPVREDMLHFLCKAKDPDTQQPAFSDNDIHAEARLLLVAGSDSTSVTLSGLFYYLGHYPQVYRKLVEEITSTFHEADEIRPGPQLASCTYLRACIDESMRMAPAGPSELPREVLPGGITINGELFPPGVVVGTARWSDGHNEEVYGDAQVFRPERWILGSETTAEEVSRIRFAFQPFTSGPFNCAGMSFALQELMLVVGKTVHRLDFRLASGYASGEEKLLKGEKTRLGHAPIFHLEDAYVSVKDGPRMQFRKRTDSS